MPAGVVTAYTYDRLDRLTRRSYSYTGQRDGGKPRDYPGGLRLRQLRQLHPGPAVLR